MIKVLHIPFTLRGISNKIEVLYKTNISANESGFDALNLPFDPNLCVGYPVVHAYFRDMASTGYRRLCGWIQLIQMDYFSSEFLDIPDQNTLVIDTNDPAIIYFSFGYPAEFYDAPCNNLNGNAKGRWTAYTYLVDMPSRMNGHKMIFLAGFQWGYEEAVIDGNLCVNVQDINEIGKMRWREHIPHMKEKYPQYDFD
jgi:hypothetical protein